MKNWDCKLICNGYRKKRVTKADVVAKTPAVEEMDMFEPEEEPVTA